MKLYLKDNKKNNKKNNKKSKKFGGTSSSTKRKLSSLKKRIATRKIQKAFRKNSKNESTKKLSLLKKKFATRKIQKAFRKDKCVICLDRINKNVKNKCSKHSFHDDCINHWIDVGNRSCPTCRIPMNLSKNENRKDNHRLIPYYAEFINYVNELNFLRDELNELDPAYLEENDIISAEIEDSIQQSQNFVNIIGNESNITEDIFNNMDNQIRVNDSLIDNIRNTYIPILEEVAEMRRQ